MWTALKISGVLLIGIAVSASEEVARYRVPAFRQQLIKLERDMLRPGGKMQKSFLELSVADDFRGIGSNGDFYDRSEVVSAAKEEKKDSRAYDFVVIALTDGAAVVSYDLIVPDENPRYRHMADIWAKVGGRWKLKFRQVTPNLWSANDTD